MMAKRKISEERGSIKKVEYGDISIEFMKEWYIWNKKFLSILSY